MKQTIRINTFETNSSSYHSLSIQKKSEKSKPREIIKGEDLIINNRIYYKKIGYTNSYSYVGVGTYEKAQLVLRFMGYALIDQFDNMKYEEKCKDEKGYRDWDKYEVMFKKHFYEIPLIKAFVKAIKKYIGKDYKVEIEFNDPYDPYIEHVSDESKYTYELFGVEEKDLTDVTKMSKVFYDIIFNDEIEIVEECESNE